MTQPTTTRPATEPPEQDAVTDVDRLVAIGRYDFDSPPLKAALVRFAKEAADLMGLPIGLVSIVLGDTQFFAGSYGIDGTWMADTGGTPVEWSFCANVVRTGDPYLVEDAETDPFQFDNPLVLLDGIRSYVGVPLVTSSGHVLGTCCTIGNTMREFADTEITALQAISRRIVDELDRHLVD
ncbi:MAG: GAF domain-containing protein [Actinomycetota bacterium]|nr:GAF domain-containing protein [Actinomycetota bacterium]